jgi:hypothetical protein
LETAGKSSHLGVGVGPLRSTPGPTALPAATVRHDSDRHGSVRTRGSCAGGGPGARFANSTCAFLHGVSGTRLAVARVASATCMAVLDQIRQRGIGLTFLVVLARRIRDASPQKPREHVARSPLRYLGNANVLYRIVLYCIEFDSMQLHHTACARTCMRET